MSLIQLSKVLCALLIASGCGALVPAAARAQNAPADAQKRARGLAALDKAVEFYAQQRSFTIAARETLSVDGAITRRTGYQLALQAPLRARLQTSAFDASGRTLQTSDKSVLGAGAYFAQVGDLPAQTRPIENAKQREAALVELVGSWPAAGIGVGAFALKTNPARLPNIEVVDYATGAERAVLVTTRNRVGPEATVLYAIYTLDAASGALRQLEVVAQLNGKRIVTRTEFEALIDNWKGSQSATDDAVYYEGNFAPGTQTAVEPQARAIFERAAKLYGSLEGLRLKWTQIETDKWGQETAQASLAYDHDGFLRLQYLSLLSSLVVVDSDYRWTVESEIINPDGPVRYRKERVDNDARASMVYSPLSVTLRLPASVAELLDPFDLHPLSPRVVAGISSVDDFISFRAVTLPAQNWNGEVCDLVQTLKESRSEEAAKRQDIRQQVYWFARSDGRLLRVQDGTRSGDEQGRTVDSQITEQEFNPKFAPDTFTFTPPKGAVLAE